MAFIVLIFSTIERYPVSLFSTHFGSYQVKVKEQKENIKFEKKPGMRDWVMRKLGFELDFEDAIDRMTKIQKFYMIVTDSDNVYNFAYLCISLVALSEPIMYAFLLFDYVKRSEDLSNVIKSVTQNIILIFKTMLLGLIVMYLYAVIGYNFFATQFGHSEQDEFKNYCHTLRACFLTVINNGLRSSGGIGEAIGQLYWDENNYWQRWIYDFSFFVFVIIILLNIIFGIIIDTFGALRDKRNDLLLDIRTNCFICGQPKFDLDTKGEGWFTHVYKNHNVYNYMYFIIYIREKDIQECNGIEKYVKDLVNHNSTAWIPQGRSLYINKDGQEN